MEELWAIINVCDVQAAYGRVSQRRNGQEIVGMMIPAVTDDSSRY